MGKRLFLLMFVGILGVMNTSGVLTAADSFEATGVDFNAVETIPLPEPEPEPEPVVTYNAPAAGYYTNTAPVNVVPQMVNYTVTSYTSEIKAHDLSNYDIYKTDHLVYGHNSGNLLGNLGSLNVGDEFTITEGGATTYRVMQKILFEKNDGKLKINGQGNYMGATMRGIYLGVQYDVALMTCAGQSLGGGDATHRLVIFANRA